MPVDNPADEAASQPNPAEREARWDLTVQFDIEAPGKEVAQTILEHAMAGLRRELRLRGTSTIQSRTRGDIWIAVLEPDLTHLLEIEPDNARTRCSFAMDHFPAGLEWVASLNTETNAAREWPPPPGRRTRGTADVALHPAVRAVRIVCRER